MSCRCSERRDAIARAFYKPKTAIRELRYVTRTASEDVYRLLARRDDAGRKLPWKANTSGK